MGGAPRSRHRPGGAAAPAPPPPPGSDLELVVPASVSPSARPSAADAESRALRGCSPTPAVSSPSFPAGGSAAPPPPGFRATLPRRAGRGRAGAADSPRPRAVRAGAAGDAASRHGSGGRVSGTGPGPGAGREGGGTGSGGAPGGHVTEGQRPRPPRRPDLHAHPRRGWGRAGPAPLVRGPRPRGLGFAFPLPLAGASRTNEAGRSHDFLLLPPPPHALAALPGTRGGCHSTRGRGPAPLRARPPFVEGARLL